MQGLQTHKWIVGTMGRSLWLVVLLCALQGVLAVVGVVYALLMRDAVDAAVAGVPAEFWRALACFAAVILLQVLMGAANRYMLERARASAENRLRDTAFALALGQDARVASSRHSGELMTRLTSDVSAVANGAVSFVPRAVSMAVRVVAVLAAMFALAPQLALTFLVLGCAMAAVSVALRGTLVLRSSISPLPRRWLRRPCRWLWLSCPMPTAS